MNTLLCITLSPEASHTFVTDDAITYVFNDSYLGHLSLFFPFNPETTSSDCSLWHVSKKHSSYSVCVYVYNLMLRGVFE